MRIRIKLILCILGTIFLMQLTSILPAAEIPEFEHIVLDANIGKVCYAVTVADVNNDGKPDPVALSENRLIWFENPTWKPHVILEDQLDLDHVCLAPHDIDGDGLIDFAVGAGWTKKGTIQWVSRDKENPDGLWKVYPIHIEPWVHRMQFADVLGTGKPQLTVSPLNKTEGDGARLLAFEIPDNPRTDRWPMTVMSHQFNRMHNHWHFLGVTLTASQEGVHFLNSANDQFEVQQISLGASGNSPAQSGAGEVKLGIAKRGKWIIAAVEPMHGNNLVVYLKNPRPDDTWKRVILDDKLGRGHALWLADIDGVKGHEIIIGHSEPATGDIKGPGIYIFTKENEPGTEWKKHILDNGGIAVEDLIAHDFDGDGDIDILAGGRHTHNVKLYLNQGMSKKEKP
ncbi:MAG: VCBS repeat-containing protein [Planctomycetaceae bacterium]|nr:VCBS repeat-containing protein [Planctomycetaceae bacterium]